MPLLEVTQTKYISASVRMTEATATQCNQYAHFITASADDVIEEGMKHIFAKDREFQEFLKSPDAQKITPTLRTRKPSVNEPESAAKKPTSGPSSPVQTPVSVAGSKA